jgi:hypothetical protein
VSLLIAEEEREGEDDHGIYDESEPGDREIRKSYCCLPFFLGECIEIEKDWGIGQHEILFPAAQPPIA